MRMYLSSVVIIALLAAAISSAFAQKRSCADVCALKCAHNPGKTLCSSKCIPRCEAYRRGER